MPVCIEVTGLLDIRITEAAAARITHLVEKHGAGALGVRVSVESAGCSGMAYRFAFADAEQPDDAVVRRDGAALLIDPQAALYLVGAEMDFVEGKLHSGFVFDNPNEKGRCGCGESFHV